MNGVKYKIMLAITAVFFAVGMIAVYKGLDIKIRFNFRFHHKEVTAHAESITPTLQAPAPGKVITYLPEATEGTEKKPVVTEDEYETEEIKLGDVSEAEDVKFINNEEVLIITSDFANVRMLSDDNSESVAFAFEGMVFDYIAAYSTDDFAAIRYYDGKVYYINRDHVSIRGL